MVMKFKKLIPAFLPLIIIGFTISSNIFILVETPLVHSGGCNESEYDGVKYIMETFYYKVFK